MFGRFWSLSIGSEVDGIITVMQTNAFAWAVLTVVLGAAGPWVSTAAADAAVAGPGVEQGDVFVSGQDVYPTFRLPAMVVTPRGAVLALAEGRKGGRGDSGDIDLVLKRSE